MGRRIFVNNFGLTLKKIRKSKKYSIEDLASIEVSKSAISRFERGEIDIAFSKLVMILDTLHVSTEEFISLANYEDTKKDTLTFSQMLLYNDIDDLEKQIDLLKQELKRNYDQLKYLNLIVYEYHMNNMKNIEVPKKKISFLIDYLFSCEFWTYYELTLFGNMIEGIPLETCLVLSKELVKKSPLLKQNRQYFETLINVLSNIVLLCVSSDKIKEAKELMGILNDFYLDETYLLERTMIFYLEDIISSSELGSYDIKNINKAIQIFELSESPNFHKFLVSYFENITKGS